MPTLRTLCTLSEILAKRKQPVNMKTPLAAGSDMAAGLSQRDADSVPCQDQGHCELIKQGLSSKHTRLNHIRKAIRAATGYMIIACQCSHDILPCND